MQSFKRIVNYLTNIKQHSKKSATNSTTEKVFTEIEMDDRRIEQYQIECRKLYDLWRNKNYIAAESYGKKIIDHDNWLPGVFDTMAKLYRRQKRYNEEIQILEIGIQAQKRHHNPGVASRNFQERIERVYELQSKE
ncbi:hypothetical protein [Lactiplantibacillus plajomi]|uniref:Prophage protein n=1 Tax=Lactiplantibacillus plajomi TaxID=1457217 RepID=A0ABV6K0S6_9LACO|nr:hypothetical protein [Lactiplantibacillus plajomi]